MATLYKANGAREEIKPWNGVAFTVAELQEHVGGYFEIQHLPDDMFMLMDEDGKLKQKPINQAASILLFGRLAGVTDWVVGDALVGTQKEFDGEPIDEEDDPFDALKALIEGERGGGKGL